MSPTMRLADKNSTTSNGGSPCRKESVCFADTFQHMLTSGIGPETSALPMRCATYCATSAKPNEILSQPQVLVNMGVCKELCHLIG